MAIGIGIVGQHSGRIDFERCILQRPVEVVLGFYRWNGPQDTNRDRGDITRKRRRNVGIRSSAPDDGGRSAGGGRDTGSIGECVLADKVLIWQVLEAAIG